MTDNALIDRLRAREPLLWINPRLAPARLILPDLELRRDAFLDAEKRWRRFAPLLETIFPVLKESGGIIESPLRPVPRLKERIVRRQGTWLPGRLMLKADHLLPIAGSVKARGGIYAVLHHAESLALRAGLLNEGDSYRVLLLPSVKTFYGRHHILVASTGNLGLSVGLMGRSLGFQVTVHMSCEAVAWKKARLRRAGAEVVEHEADYTAACAEAREAASGKPRHHFVDDENSQELFLGYSVAALRLRDQLLAANILVGPARPLFVYLPCGVGGAPGGITFGLKQVWGDSVHCFFGEPVAAPSMLLGLATRRYEQASVYDIGLLLDTEADGLAVARPSRLVSRMMERLISGCYTVSDDQLYRNLADLKDTEEMRIEPSAAAGVAGPLRLLGSAAGEAYLRDRGLSETVMEHATHLIWTTGGALVPDEEYARFYERGRLAAQRR